MAKRVHYIAPSEAAWPAGTIWVFTWSIRSLPVVVALRMDVSEIGEH